MANTSKALTPEDLQDNVFVNVVASIQYRALAGKASDAFYKLSNTRSQIQAYVFDGMNSKQLKIYHIGHHLVSTNVLFFSFLVVHFCIFGIALAILLLM